MNRITLTGRVVAKPELRYTSSNKGFTRFSIGVNRQKEGADFINCIAWDKTAELICNYLDKGSFIGIEGRLQTSSYEKQDGTKGYTTDVYVQNIEFLNSKKKEENKSESKHSYDPYEEMSNQIELDITNDFLD